MALEKVLEVLEPEHEMAQQRWRYSRVFVLLLIYNQHVNVLQSSGCYLLCTHKSCISRRNNCLT